MTPSANAESRQKAPQRLLVVNMSAGSVNPELVARLRDELPRYSFVEYHKKLRLARLLEGPARVVVAGGDGAVETLARQLMHTPHTLGILPAGTYNNFAAGLGIPGQIEAALKVIKTGRPRPISVGRVNGHPFMEAVTVGVFGEALLLGEATKERDFGELLKRLSATVRTPKFKFSVEGDLQGSGEVRNLFFANTPRIGARVRVGDGTPIDARLELSLRDVSFRFQRLRLRTQPRMQVFADADRVTRTPVSIEVDPGALTVILGRA